MSRAARVRRATRLVLVAVIVAFIAAACGGHAYRSSRVASATTVRGGVAAANAASSTTASAAGSHTSSTTATHRGGGAGTNTGGKGSNGSGRPATTVASGGDTAPPPPGGGPPTSCSGLRAPQLGVGYGPAALDVFPVTGSCAYGVVVFVHGGGYCCGDRAQLIDAVVPWFHAQGWAVVSVDYRLHVRYPAFADDVAAAVAWVHAHAASFGAPSNRVVLLGHSTGAEIAAEVGTNPSLLAASGGLRCAGALDGTAFDIQSWLASANATSRRIYEDAYGTSPAGWAAASAMTFATPGHGIPPFLVVERGGETAAKLAQQQRFAAALRGAGVPVQTIDASSIGHAQVVSNLGRAGDHVMTAPMAAFLARCR